MRKKLILTFFVALLGFPMSSFATSKTVLDAVESAIANDPTIGNFKIEAGYNNGLVTLKGEVASEEAMYRTLSVARAAKGVTGLRNRLTINSALAPRQMMARPKLIDDKTVATNLMRNLERDMKLPNDFTIYVYGGGATFKGTASSHRQIDKILSTALMTNGVTSIKNEMTIGGKPY
jgi:osmotically-inducible protein OsmY